MKMMIFSYSSVPVVILLVVFIAALAHGFVQPLQTYKPSMTSLMKKRTFDMLFMSSDNDDDESINPDDLGDWRAFRMNLANTDISATSASSIIDGIELEETNEVVSPSSSSIIATTSKKAERPKSVSKRNEQLLSAQNSVLAEEYRTGVWAHESAIPEVGGLVCRMPLEAEIYRNPNSHIHKKLQSLLESEDDDDYTTADYESSIPDSLKSSASTGGAASASSVGTSSSKSSGIIERSIVGDSSASNNDDDDENDDISSSFSALAAKTVFWYRNAEKLLKRELVTIMSSANPNGRINPGDLGEDSLELLQLYMDHQNTWQEVCLVIEKDEKTGCSKTITINRPMAFKLSESLGRLVLYGAAYNDQVSTSETQSLVKFLSVFENECGVYVGGPDDMDKPAVMIHGIDDLEGAEEISPGTGIFKGGMEAAMTGILSGKYKALDFRFFVGHTSYIGGQLDEAVREGKYQPVACSRPLVLKQCIQLPKPLWHEVLEFCGGELKEISKLELTKREDLQ